MENRCRHCGEPFDMDEFHDGQWPWEQWAKAFTRFGCGAVDALFDDQTPQASSKCKNEPVLQDEDVDAIGVIQDMLGDDYDGACSMILNHVG